MMGFNFVRILRDMPNKKDTGGERWGRSPPYLSGYFSLRVLYLRQVP
jgi:hypothetical protein